MKSFKARLNFDHRYLTINREERNIAAIFYHTLLLENNLERFINSIDPSLPIIHNEIGIYFEYAFLRDLWKEKVKPLNDEKRKRLIVDFLKPKNGTELMELTPNDFNSYFGAAPGNENSEIQSPSNWSIQRFNDNPYLKEHNDEFLKVCKFKWCFNAKPDIVIHTSLDSAICIEAKYVSDEGKYPSNSADRKIFRERFKKKGIKGGYLVGQLEIQRKIMDLLGIETRFVLMAKEPPTKLDSDIIPLTWNESFDKLETRNCPPFIKAWITSLRNNHQ